MTDSGNSDNQSSVSPLHNQNNNKDSPLNPEENPYQVPQADVATLDTHEFHGPRAKPSGNGIGWLGDAWRLFKLSPGLWIAMFIIYLVCMVVLSFVPFIGSIFTPVFVAGYYRAAQTASEEGVVRIEDLFSGFRERPGPLILVGVLTLVFMALIAVIGMAGGMAVMHVAMSDVGTGAPSLLAILLLSIVIATLILPILMMSWFAPALVLFEGMGSFEAMKCSFQACLKNVGPFTLYSLVLLGLGLLALLPLGLGLLILLPVMMLTAFTSYQDIFIAND